MSDTRLRNLERRWKETGSTPDEAAYLLERVRVGELTRERLELGAYCGDPASVLATGQVPAHAPDSDEWIKRLHAWGPGPGLIASRVALSLAIEAAHEHTEADVARRVSDTVGAWLADGATPPAALLRSLRGEAWLIFQRNGGARMPARAASSLAGHSLALLEGTGLGAPLTQVRVFLGSWISSGQIGAASAPQILAWSRSGRGPHARGPRSS